MKVHRNSRKHKKEEAKGQEAKEEEEYGEEDSDGGEEEEEGQCECIACDKCSKWHKLAPGAAPWPESRGFECLLNSWDLSKVTCTAQDDEEAAK